MSDLSTIVQRFKDIQQSICDALEGMDGKARFASEEWARAEGGGGLTRVIQNGAILEKGGVNFSHVHGTASPKLLQLLHVPNDGKTEYRFDATGISIVLHPHSPMSPIIHMNIRYFELSNGIWWFGGGIDLTPHYIRFDLAKQFHQQLASVCQKHHADYYPAFKRWADDYFYLAHRKETRGVGGIFFDRLDGAEGAFTKEQRWQFVQDVGMAFAPIYIQQIEQTRDLPYTEREKQWQYLRRGRYVEFNLIWDRGTKFGLETDGRTESILMSLPPQANWAYNFQPEADSPEAFTQEWLKKGVDWL